MVIDLLQYNVEIKKDKASLKHFMTSYQILSVDCFLDFIKILLPSVAWLLQFFLTVLMIFLVISLIAGFWSDMLLTLMFHLFVKHNQNVNRAKLNLKLVSAIFYQVFIFHHMIALQKLWKMFFISSKKHFSFLRYLNFCIFVFPLFFPSQPLLQRLIQENLKIYVWWHELSK